MAATAPALNEYEILIDESTATAQGNGWLARGMDPTLFPQGAIPFKRILFENGVNNHSVASKYYALAHRARRVEGLPCWLVIAHCHLTQLFFVYILSTFFHMSIIVWQQRHCWQ